MRVIKIGGRVQSDAAVITAIADAWMRDPGGLCLVHGGGEQLSAMQRSLGIEPAFVRGRRITSAEDMALVRMVLSGSANKQLVSVLASAGVSAVGISGEDGGLLQAALAEGGALGRVGSPASVNTRLPRALLSAGFLPVISPLGHDAEHEPLNVNGDDAAAALAAALGADELLFLADVPGVLSEGSIVPRLDADSALSLISQGVAEGGMAAKLEAAVRALDAGVRLVRIGDHFMLTNNSSGSAITPAGSLV